MGKTFKDKFISESREEIKQSFLSKNYTKNDLEALMKKGSTTIQYKTTKSRKGVASGEVISVSSDGVKIKSSFADELNKEIIIPFKDITVADNVK